MARKGRHSRLELGLGGVIYVAVAAVMLGVGVYTQANLLFWLFGLMVGGLVVSGLMALLVLRRVRVQRLSPGYGLAGEKLVLRYRLTNPSRLPIFSVVIMETWGPGRRDWRTRGPLAEHPPMLTGRPHGWVLHLGARQSVQAEAPCWPLRRGELRFEHIALSCAFPFGVVRKVVEIEQPTDVIVYPQVFRLQRPLIHSLSDYDPGGRKQLERGGGMEEFFGLRPYRHGDSLKMIDWKHSARIGELVSREMTQPSPPRIMVLLELRAIERTLADQPEARPSAASDTGDAPASGTSGASHNGPGAGAGAAPERSDSALAFQALMAEFTPWQRAVERAISLTASLVCEAHLQGFQVGLAVAGCAFKPFPVHHSLPHCMKMLEALARLDIEQSASSNGRLPARPSVIVHPGLGDPPPLPGRRMGTLRFGAANMEQYVVGSEVGRQLLEQRERLRTRREALEAEAAESARAGNRQRELAHQTTQNT